MRRTGASDRRMRRSSSLLECPAPRGTQESVRMKSIALLFIALSLVAVGFTACGGSSNNSTTAKDAGTDDAGDDAGDDASDDADQPDAAPRDHGKPSTTYPAFKPDMPELQS